MGDLYLPMCAKTLQADCGAAYRGCVAKAQGCSGGPRRGEEEQCWVEYGCAGRIDILLKLLVVYERCPHVDNGQVVVSGRQGTRLKVVCQKVLCTASHLDNLRT